MSRQGVCLVASFSALVGMGAAQPPAEGSLGRMPVPEVVKMSGECPGYVLASGPVDAAEHEAQDGYASIGSVTLMAPPESAAGMRLRSEAGRTFDLVLRPVGRDLQRVER
jgi:hypothetical protein